MKSQIQHQQQILTPLIDASHQKIHQVHHDQYKQEQEHEQQQQKSQIYIPSSQQHPSRHQMHFVRSNNSNVHQLTPTNTNKKSTHIPLYSRGSTHQTIVTTPNPTSSSTNRNTSNLSIPTLNNNMHSKNMMAAKSPQKYEERFKFHGQPKNKHQYKTSSGDLIAIERSVGPKSSPKLPVIAQNNQLFDMLTNDPIPSSINRSRDKTHTKDNKLPKALKPQRSKSHDHSSRKQRPIPRKPLLPPKIIKLDSPTVTTNGNLSSSSDENHGNNNGNRKRKRHRHHHRSSGFSDIPNIDHLNIDHIINERRTFQITRRPLSPSKPPPKATLHDDMSDLNLNSNPNSNSNINDFYLQQQQQGNIQRVNTKRRNNTNTNAQKRIFPAIALVSDSVHTNAANETEEKSSQVVDYLSDMISGNPPQIEKHPTNEYDPLDLNDSAMKSSRWTPQQMPVQPSPPSPSPQPQQQITYPMLSFVDLFHSFISSFFLCQF